MLVVPKRFTKGSDLLIFLGLLYRVLSIVSGELFLLGKFLLWSWLLCGVVLGRFLKKAESVSKELTFDEKFCIFVD